MSVPDLLHALQLLRHHAPDAPALALLTGLKEEFRWSYLQLLQTTLGFRGALAAGGIGTGSSVCVIAGNSPQFVALFLACVDLGAAFVPMHPDQSDLTLSAMLRQLRPALVVVDEDLPDALLRSVSREADTIWRLRIRRRPWLRPVPARQNYSRDAGLVVERSAAASGEDPVLILHSSGSTGAPKVIQYSRRRLNVFLHWQRYLFSAFPDADDTTGASPRVNALPLAHFGGLSFVLQALLDGRLVHLPRTIAPIDYLRLAMREQCQLLMLVPSLYEALLGDVGELRADSPLRYCLTMGEAVTPQLIESIQRVTGARVYSAYGMSEGLSGLAHHGDDTPADSCGRLAFGEAKLVASDGDPDSEGEEGEEGEEGAEGTEWKEGELWVRNETTFPCYRDPELNRAKFSDNWYRTGDRFRRDARGHHYFLGRVDAMCVVNGRNVYPADVEQVFLRHPDIVDCMAAVITLEQGRQRWALLACVRPGSSASPAGLIDWFLERGAVYATPAWLLLGKGIPRNTAGKRDRQAVAALLQNDYRQCLKKVS